MPTKICELALLHVLLHVGLWSYTSRKSLYFLYSNAREDSKTNISPKCLQVLYMEIDLLANLQTEELLFRFIFDLHMYVSNIYFLEDLYNIQVLDWHVAYESQLSKVHSQHKTLRYFFTAIHYKSGLSVIFIQSLSNFVDCRSRSVLLNIVCVNDNSFLNRAR